MNARKGKHEIENTHCFFRHKHYLLRRSTPDDAVDGFGVSIILKKLSCELPEVFLEELPLRLIRAWPRNVENHSKGTYLSSTSRTIFPALKICGVSAALSRKKDSDIHLQLVIHWIEFPPHALLPSFLSRPTTSESALPATISLSILDLYFIPHNEILGMKGVRRAPEITHMMKVRKTYRLFTKPCR